MNGYSNVKALAPSLFHQAGLTPPDYSTLAATSLIRQQKALTLWQTEASSHKYHRLLVAAFLNELADSSYGYPTNFWSQVMPLIVKAREVLQHRGIACPVDYASSNRAMQTVWVRLQQDGNLEQVFNSGLLKLDGKVQQQIMARLDTEQHNSPLILKEHTGFKVALTGKHKLDSITLHLNGTDISCPFVLPKPQRNSLQKAIKNGSLVELTIVHKTKTAQDLDTLAALLPSLTLSKGIFLRSEYIPQVNNCPGISYSTEFHFKVKHKNAPTANPMHVTTAVKGCSNYPVTGHTEALVTSCLPEPPKGATVGTEQAERRELSARRRKSTLVQRTLTSGQYYRLYSDPAISPRKRSKIEAQVVEAAISSTCIVKGNKEDWLDSLFN